MLQRHSYQRAQKQLCGEFREIGLISLRVILTSKIQQRILSQETQTLPNQKSPKKPRIQQPHISTNHSPTQPQTLLQIQKDHSEPIVLPEPSEAELPLKLPNQPISLLIEPSLLINWIQRVYLLILMSVVLLERVFQSQPAQQPRNSLFIRDQIVVYCTRHI